MNVRDTMKEQKQAKSKNNFGKKNINKSQGKGGNKQNSKVALMLPLILVLGLVPLVTRLEILPVAAEVQPFWKTVYDTDFFSYYKAILLVLLAIYMIILMVEMKRLYL